MLPIFWLNLFKCKKPRSRASSVLNVLSVCKLFVPFICHILHNTSFTSFGRVVPLFLWKKLFHRCFHPRFSLFLSISPSHFTTHSLIGFLPFLFAPLPSFFSIFEQTRPQLYSLLSFIFTNLYMCSHSTHTRFDLLFAPSTSLRGAHRLQNINRQK